MTIYLLKDYPEYAAVSSADAVSMLTALADPTNAANALTIGIVQDKLKALTVCDTGEPLVISSIDDTSATVSSWVTDASTTLAVSLGDPDTMGNLLYASTISFAISGNTRTGTLALNTLLMQSAIQRGRMLNPPGGLKPINLTLQITKTTNGVTQTVGWLLVRVLPPVSPGTPIDNGTVSYVTTVAARAGYIINLSGVTSLTGGGPTTLDGQDAGSTSFPVGCIVLTSDGDVGRNWKLKAGTIGATNLALGQVKPTNSYAAYWQLI